VTGSMRLEVGVSAWPSRRGSTLGNCSRGLGFIVTNFRTSSRAVVRFYNKRRTAEQWIKEGKQAVAMTRLSCHRFRSNQARRWLGVIAYDLGDLWAAAGAAGTGR
jgi:hypothetical protein